jgi:hypothetical protein
MIDVLQVHVDVVADPNRLFQPTKSLLSEAEQHGAVFSAMYGFTSDQITSDKRFRALQKMQEKGIADKPYAQEVLRMMHRRTLPTRRDCQTSDERLGLL